MPKVTRVKDRAWQDSTFDPRSKRVTLLDARATNQGRTIISRYPPGVHVPPQRSDAPWEIFLLSGDLTVNGENLGPGDHVLCLPGEQVGYESQRGCECLLFIRTNHEWVSS